MTKELTDHAKRCLGALAALTDREAGRITFFSRWEMGCIVYGHIQGIQLKTMTALGRQGFVRPEVPEAVSLVADGYCRCGCDRWSLTEAGHNLVKLANVKVPVLAPSGPGHPLTMEEFKELFRRDPRLS